MKIKLVARSLDRRDGGITFIICNCLLAAGVAGLVLLSYYQQQVRQQNIEAQARRLLSGMTVWQAEENS